LCPLGVAIIPGSIRFADARRGAIDWIHMHGGMHRWKRLRKGNVLSDRLIAQLIYKISAPVPLKAGRVQRIEHALQSWLRQATYKIERRLLESANRLERLLAFILRPRVCPDNAAHFFHVQMFRERRRRRDREKGEKAI